VADYRKRVRRAAAGVALTLAALVAVAVVGVLWLAGTDAGRSRALAFVIDAANGAFDGRGRLEVGRLASVRPDDLRLEDVRLVDSAGVPIVRAARVRGALSVRDLWRGLVRIPRLELDSVQLDLRQEFTGPFNIQWLLAGDPLDTAPPRVGRQLGDDVRIDEIVLRHGTVDARYPWAPHPLFVTPAERDSVIATHDSLHELIPVGDRFLERRTVDIALLRGRDLVLITPDDAPGSLVIDSAALGVSDPPVSVRGLRGELRWYDDSLAFVAPEVLLPDSRLGARGVLSWYQPGPVRYDVAIDAPDVALADINWTWPVMPDEGRATATVRLRTLENPDHLEVTLSALEARAMDSRITGALRMVAEVRDFLLHDVALAFEPLTTALAARLTEDALPPELDGRLTGRFVAREGGSLTALRIDTLQFAFDDALVPGARSRLRASGVVALGVTPSATDVRIADVSVDLRSVRTLVPDLPPLVNGTVSGSGRVASASLESADLRDLTLQWTDEAGNVSSVTGRSAVRWGPRVQTADLSLQLERFDLAALGRLDTAFTLRGQLTGALDARGPLDSLTFTARLGHAADGAGALRADGWLGARLRDDDSLAWRADVVMHADTLDVQPWLLDGMAPSTRLAGEVALAARGVGAEVDTARVATALAQLASPAHTPFSLYSLGTWGRDALLVDSLVAVAPGARLEASGGLARDSAGRESFRGSLRMDSLSVVRRELPRLARMIAQVDTASATSVRALADDSLSGDVNASVYGEGSFADYMTSVAVAGNQVRVGDIVVGRLFGSTRADNLPGAASFVAAATVDSVEGIGALRIATVNFGVDDATAARGALRFDLMARDTSRLRLRGQFARGDDTLIVRVDSVGFTYADVAWANEAPFNLRDRPTGFAIDSFALTSNQGGSLRLGADVPLTDPIHAFLRLDQFPAGELAAFALGTERLPGLLSGAAELIGVRADPQLRVRFVADSLGTAAATLSGVRLEADYDAQQLAARVAITDTAGRALRGEITLPADLRLQEVIGDRVYTEALSGSLVADSLRLRDLPLRLADVRDLDGFVHGRIALSGTFDQPTIEGRMWLNDGTLFSDILGIRPRETELAFVAGGDSLHVERFRFQSGPRASDTLSLTATVRRPLRDGPGLTLDGYLNNVALARQADGTDVDLTGSVRLSGALTRPTVTADLFVPRANLVLDLTEARTVLDLGSAEAQALLRPEELPTAVTTDDSFASLGEYLEARDVRVRLGDDVWVRTREAAVKLAGGVTVLEAAGQRLSLEGEVQVERGTYRLDLGVVNRPFAVDSGRVRFFPQDGLNPSLDVHARHIVRGVNGRDVEIDVAIGGTLEDMTLALGTRDDAYASAPESEFISLLVFGAPTFALDGQRQQTVRAVTGVLVPTLGGAVEGTLQRLLPVFNTVQVSTAGGQTAEELGTLSSLLGNLSVTAGKQLGRRTYLRLDTGVCRGLANSASGGSLNLWYGIATEYRIAPGLTGQVGLDPGPSPCGARLGGSAPRMQLGFDLFKAWIF
jgi:translocation and assembly module TamB